MGVELSWFTSFDGLETEGGPLHGLDLSASLSSAGGRSGKWADTPGDVTSYWCRSLAFMAYVCHRVQCLYYVPFGWYSSCDLYMFYVFALYREFIDFYMPNIMRCWPLERHVHTHIDVWISFHLPSLRFKTSKLPTGPSGDLTLSGTGKLHVYGK